MNRPPKCRHNHGHEGLVKVHISGDVQPDGMVTDFCNLGWLKKFIDDELDHKFIFGSEDPWYEKYVLSAINPIYIPETDIVVAHTINTDGLGALEKEVLEGYVMVNFIPTSENLCKWLFDIVSIKMKRLGVTVSQVDWWETPKSMSSYSTQD